MKEHEMFQPTSRTSEKWGGLVGRQKKNVVSYGISCQSGPMYCKIFMLIKPIFQVLHQFLGEGKETTFRWEKQEVTIWHWKFHRNSNDEKTKRCSPQILCSLNHFIWGKKMYPNWSIRWGWLIQSLISRYFGDVGKVEGWIEASHQQKLLDFFAADVGVSRLEKRTSCVQLEPTLSFFTWRGTF